MKLAFSSLFSGFARSAEPVTSPAGPASISGTTAVASLYSSSTGEEYNEFLCLMQQGKRPFRKPGRPIRAEYEAWLAHHRSRNHTKPVSKSA